MAITKARHSNQTYIALKNELHGLLPRIVPPSGYLTKGQMLGAAKTPNVNGELLDAVILDIDPDPDGKRRINGIIIDVGHDPGPIDYTFRHP